MHRLYDEKILFPFVGLVKECNVGVSFCGETAMLTQPPNLESKMPTVKLVDVGAGFAKQISALRSLKAEYANDAGAVTGFNARIDALYRQAADIGLVVISGLGSLTPLVPRMARRLP